MKEEYQILCIFTQTGRTYTFKNITMLCNNETVLQFEYTAMSDGQAKTATFPKNTICGWSVTPVNKVEIPMKSVGSSAKPVIR